MRQAKAGRRGLSRGVQRHVIRTRGIGTDDQLTERKVWIHR